MRLGWLVGMMVLQAFSWAGAQNTDLLSQWLGRWNSYHAHWVQTQHSTHEQSQGELWVDKQGNFRWEMQQPESKTVIVHGGRMWVIDRALNQVIVQPLNAQQQGAMRLFSLTGDQLHAAYHVTSKRSAHRVSLVPLNSSEAVVRIDCYFSHQGQLQALSVHNQLGEQVMVRLSQARYDPRIAPSTWVASWPKDADVLDETQR